MLLLLALACAPATTTGDPAGGDDTAASVGDGDPTLDSGVVQDDAIVDIAVGHTWACALWSDGTAECEYFDTPTADLVDIDGDWGTLCGRTIEGEGACWGDVSANLGPAVALAVGSGFVCWQALNGDAVQCEGDIAAPPGHSGLHSLSAGGGVACAVDEAGAVTCWGDRSFTDGSRWEQVSVGPTGDVCALRGDGEIRCWGVAAPESVQGAKRLATGDGWVVAELDDGTAVALGEAPWTKEVQESIGPVRLVEASAYFACGVGNEGDPICWGR